MKKLYDISLLCLVMLLTFSRLGGQNNFTFGLIQDPVNPLEITAVAYPNFSSDDVTIPTAAFSFLVPAGTVTTPAIPPLTQSAGASFNNITGQWIAQLVTAEVYEVTGGNASQLQGYDVYNVTLQNSPMPSVKVGEAVALFSFSLVEECKGKDIVVLTNNGPIQTAIFDRLFANFNNQISVSIDGRQAMNIYAGNDAAGYAECGASESLPSAQDDYLTADVGQSTDIWVLNNDDFGPDGAGAGLLTVTVPPSVGIAQVMDGGAADQSDDWIMYTPNSEAQGADIFTYEICDGSGDCVEAVVYISINNHDDSEMCDGGPVDATGCLACNDQINVTLDANCSAFITLDMVAEGKEMNNCPSELEGYLEVIVYDGYYPNDYTGDGIGDPDNQVEKCGLFNYVIQLADDAPECLKWNHCWGTVNAEDKTPPKVTVKPHKVFGLYKYLDHYENVRFTPYNCNSTDFDRCFEDRYGVLYDDCRTFEFNKLVCEDVDHIYQTPASWLDADYPYFTGFPVVEDACGEVELVGVDDWLEEFACEKRADRITAVIKRTFTFKDAKGNLSSAVQEICFFRPRIILPDCKLHVDICAYEEAGGRADLLDPKTLEALVPEGEQPAPFYFNGICEKVYLDDHLCDLTVSYTDQEFPAPCGKKIVRTWSVLDWCWDKIEQRGRYTYTGSGCYYGLYEESEEGGYWNQKKFEFEQHIIMGVYDEMAFECEEEIRVTTGPFNCTAVVAPASPKMNSCVAVDVEFEIWGDVQDPKTGLSTYQLIGHSNNGVLSGVAKGTYDLFYRLEDECGRQYTGVWKDQAGQWQYDWDKACTLIVQDDIEPVAVCDDELNVSLGGANTIDGGIAVLHAEDVDEGSWDNCGPVKLLVRRNFSNEGCIDAYIDQVVNNAGLDHAPGVDRGGFTEWAEAVYFTCCDVGEDITVELLVVDDGNMDGIYQYGQWVDADGDWLYPMDNTNKCWLTVSPENKLAPRCEIADAVISCEELDFDPNDAEQVAARFGAALPVSEGGILDIQANCNGLEISEVLNFNGGACSTGQLTREITVRTNGGLSTTCKQVIEIETVNRYSIKFPGDQTIRECGGDPLSPPSIAQSDACDILAVNADTALFEAAGSECFKRLITYRVMNWCEYDGESLEPTIIPRDVDEDHVLEGECTLLEAEYESGLRRKYPVCGSMYIPNEAFIVKVYDAAPDGTKKSDYPVKILFRETCLDNKGNPQGFVGPLVLRLSERDQGGFYGDAPCYEAYCPTTGPQTAAEYEALVDAACSNRQYGQQCWTPGFYEYTQIQKVFDNEAPVVTSRDTMFCAYGDPTGSGVFPCGTAVEVSFKIDDDCTPGQVSARKVRLLKDRETLKQEFTLADGLFEVVRVPGTSNEYVIRAPSLPVGKHAFLLNASDGCGNVVGERIDFEVKDCKTPAPICIQILTIDLMPVREGNNVGMNTVWATDVITSPIRDCSPHEEADRLSSGQNDVKYFIFSQRTLDSMGVDGITPQDITADDLRDEFTSAVFTCEDMPNQLVYVFALDGAGNFDYCTAMVDITPGNDVACGGTEDIGNGFISGMVMTEEVSTVSEVSIQLSGPMNSEYMTSEEGDYHFDDLIEGYDYSVTPSRDFDYLNGVSTFDLVLISKHILGVKPLNSPYKLIAADVNKSRSITTLDLIQLRKVILNVEAKFQNNKSWRFVPAGYRFADPSDPWSTLMPEILNLNNLSGSMEEQDFIAIKIGDVNGSAVPNKLAAAEPRDRSSSFVLTAREQKLEAGKEYTIAFNATDLADIEGYQFTLNFESSSLELVELVYGLAVEEHFGLFPEQGMITSSWNGKAGEGPLFSLVFRATQDVLLSEVLNIGSRLTPAEAYSTDGDLMDVALRFEGATEDVDGYQLYQNRPNPFYTYTTIGFELPEATEGTLSIQDVNGRTLQVIKRHFVKGYNEILIDRTDLTSGVLYYSLKTKEYAATRKMIMIK